MDTVIDYIGALLRKRIKKHLHSNDTLTILKEIRNDTTRFLHLLNKEIKNLEKSF